ncbi:hypothetical protein STEG23_007710, partial [Scotinomys teguina]
AEPKFTNFWKDSAAILGSPLEKSGKLKCHKNKTVFLMRDEDYIYQSATLNKSHFSALHYGLFCGHIEDGLPSFAC